MICIIYFDVAPTFDQDKSCLLGELEQERTKTKAEMSAQERRLAKKRKMKELFDNEYDMKGDNEFYESWKAETDEQAKVRVLASADFSCKFS